MTSATLNLRVQPRRILKDAEAAYYCVLTSKHFKAQCPVRPIVMANKEDDIQALDRWIDTLGGAIADDDDIVGRLGDDRQGSGFQIFEDRHGKWRCYHRKTGVTVDLKIAPIDRPNSSQHALALPLKRSRRCRSPARLTNCSANIAPIPHSRILAEQTRSDYQKVFDYMKPISDTPLTRFDRPLVVRIRDKAALQWGRRFANYVKACCSIIFSWRSERGYLTSNPASGIKDI